MRYFADYVVFALAAVLVLTSSWIFFVNNTNQSDKRHLRDRVQLQWHHLWQEVKEHPDSDRVRQMFAQAGISIQPATFLYIRISTTVIALLYALYSYSIAASWIHFLIPVIVWFSFSVRLPVSPLQGLLLVLHARQQRKLIRELTLLYQLTKNELTLFASSNRNLYQMFEEFLPLFQVLHPPLNRLLRTWKRDPQVALDTFVSDVGIKQAEPFAKVMQQIQLSNVSAALDILNRDFQSLKSDRVSLFARGVQRNSIIGSAIGTFVFMLVMMDQMSLIFLYNSHIMSNL